MTFVLVTYASKHTATAGIARAISEVLQEAKDTWVDTFPVHEVEDITPYDAIVLGSAVYAGRWQDKAAEFLRENEAQLAKRRIWLFSSGPVGEGNPEDLTMGWTFPEALKPVAERIKPHDIALFHGSIDPAKLNLVEKLVIKGLNAPTGDFRDWDVILGWAQNITQALQAEPV
jgi:menaquinone-dependent protoporphyrinogen oxidase